MPERYDRQQLPESGHTPLEIEAAFLKEVARFDALMQQVPLNVPWREQGWTALQIQGHLIRTHELVALILQVMRSKQPHHRLLHMVAAAQQRQKMRTAPDRLLAPDIVQPSERLDAAKLKGQWEKSSQTFLQQLRHTPLSIPGTFPHMYIGELTAREWAQFVPYHLRHHLCQLEALQPVSS